LPGSSATYSARLRADRRLRHFVIATGALAGTAGLVVIATLPGGPELKGLAGLGWCLLVGVELAAILRGYRSCRAIRLRADGRLEVEGRDGRCRAGRLLPGSVVLGRWAWLRVASTPGASWGELLGADGQDREQWRRFQVICRHLTAC
jgi:hypothetical protein